MWRSFPALLLAAAVVSCAQPRAATVPFPASDARARAVHILESFDYNVVEQDGDAGVVRGVRLSERRSQVTADVLAGAPPQPRGVLWEVTVHVTPEEDGTRARYRLEGSATGGLGHREGGAFRSDGSRFRSARIPPSHLDRILAALADWRH